MTYDYTTRALSAVIKKCPSFFGFHRKLTRTKTKQSTDKVSEQTGVHYFCAYQHVVVSTGGVTYPDQNYVYYGIFYPIYIGSRSLSSARYDQQYHTMAYQFFSLADGHYTKIKCSEIVINHACIYIICTELL